MQIRRLAIENVRSFFDRREISFDGQISILIGPNGGGKTNLLDTLVIMLRRYIFNSPYYRHAPTADEPDRWEEQYNDQLNQLFFEKNSAGGAHDQVVELEIEVTQDDIDNMQLIQSEAGQVLAAQKRRFISNPWQGVEDWDIAAIVPGARVVATWKNGTIVPPPEAWAQHFLRYLHVFETDNNFRAEAGMSTLRMPMVYLPVNRTTSGFNSSIGLSGYNDFDQKRSSDAVSSRSGSNLIPLAIGRLAKKYRLLQEQSNIEVKDIFYKDENLIALSRDLGDLNYSWELVTVDPLSNTYDVRLTKQGSSFLVGAASSGERELLTYLFAIYALNVRNALIIVDEPELHLHPRWQSALFALFEKLSKTTGNQFVLATHSPTFISPASIQYVSRVFSENQKSDIVRLNSTALPNAKHLFNVVNTQNNERVFFTDKVILVEGLSDRIVFERVLEIVAKQNGIQGIPSLEVVSVGGKGLFTAYQKLLEACHVKWVVIADLDYIEQVGSGDVKNLFVLNADEIKDDVIANVKSLDGAALVERIEEALSSGDWKDAQDLWAYIKSHRVRLRPNLDAADQAILDTFIGAKEADNMFILRRGALENYLPEGHKSKDMGALITLVSSNDFWDQIPLEPRADLERIARVVLGIPPAPPEAAKA
ncbi:AAA family ATPase [Mesorhizobium sp. CA14]|uniref:AAA family ATPase n=1 Tax=Mesorhizobium sp. CA14 TaxID=2876642 RepID=UPI001CCDBB19|nr:AAA family ATPase [Mesorhizobium sp. CA14]MBZ9848620.1 AAA family ATPase [Mesorhizobium sp. CA14]